MGDLFKKDPARETNKIKSVQNEQTMPEITGKVGTLQVEELPSASDILELTASLRKMRTEEQQLLQIKQDLLKKQQDLKSRLVKEIAEKKIAIDDLKSEIPGIQNSCRKLGQVLGVDIYR